MTTIVLNQATIRNEIQEKLKNLQKFKQSDDFLKIKAHCEAKVETLSVLIESLLKDRVVKTEKHETIYSELDFMIKGREFVEEITAMTKNKAFNQESLEQLENIKSHLYLQAGNFDYCVYSLLDGVKHQYKLYLGIEESVNRMITKYEMQDKDIDIDHLTNPYDEVKEALGNIEV